ncbi:vacuolar protein sorting-associated protein 26C isoform X1 [Diabrotica virgifera virgifera]|uniref:Down syndrome critical region protein 3 homolog n=2 Tax=Diabrotica virgifera virgifera TaxID=50390 RepID=A0ABM5L481_DIAVI|nr:vacuolar protein sorting-associated protein 26C isoform X1 [Diabrotica virgifera virgifera]
MSINLEINLKRADKIYYEGENLAGVIMLSTNSDFKHEGITLTMEGCVNLQISSKNVGIIEAFYNSVKPIQLVGTSCEVCGPGRLPSGTTEIPFEIPLKPKPNRTLYETYNGVYVNIGYNLKCDIKRSFLSKDLQKSQQFLVQYKPGYNACPQLPLTDKRTPLNFELSPATLTNARAGVPNFLLKGHVETVCCNIAKPLRGKIVLAKCDVPVTSIELQLVRVETCGCAEGYAREATEIQNIQIGDGDVPHHIPIPIYMVFPRLFTCPTLITTNFKVEFEINLVIVFQGDHLVTNNFPIILVRE